MATVIKNSANLLREMKRESKVKEFEVHARTILTSYAQEDKALPIVYKKGS